MRFPPTARDGVRNSPWWRSEEGVAAALVGTAAFPSLEGALLLLTGIQKVTSGNKGTLLNDTELLP